MAWKVPIVMREAARRPRRSSSRWRISAAAWLVKVTAVISPGRTPRSSTSHAIRSTRVLVLPVPGPATTATVRSSAEMAACCWGLSAGGPAPPPCSAAFRPLWELSPLFLPLFWGSPLPQTGRPVRSGAGSPPGQGGDGTVFPVKPGAALHLPQPQAPDALRHAGPASRCRSSMGTSRRIVNSGPRVCSKRSYCSRVFSRRPSRRWRRRSPPAGGPGSRRGLASSGRKPAGRSASSSTRCSTPMVSFFPHTGHSPPRSAVSAGVRHTPQFRCPSRWYFPSSGKNSRVPRSPSPVRIAWTSSG